MSLIEEALRRAQDPTLPKTSTAPPAKTGAATPDPTTAHPWPLTTSAARPPIVASHALIIVAVAILGLTVALIIGGAFWMGRTFSARPRPVIAEATPASVAEPEPLPPPPLEAPAVAPPAPRTLDLGALMRGKRQEPDFTLSGVVAGEGNAYAVMNGKIVSLGDYVEGFTVIAITDNAVTLRDQEGNDRILRIPR
jgi:hypothetical protein